MGYLFVGLSLANRINQMFEDDQLRSVPFCDVLSVPPQLLSVLALTEVVPFSCRWAGVLMVVDLIRCLFALNTVGVRKVWLRPKTARPRTY